jgi:mono/diheme cytochrome c family protein
MGVVALSGIAIIGLAAAVAIGLAFVGGLIWLTLRGKPGRKPDIPQAMRPGPADETLERAKVVSLPGWGTLFVLFFTLWIPFTWLNEPTVNVADEVEAVERSVERGSRWFQVSSEENPTGFGCARCHGANAEGGTVSFTTPDGEVVPEYPVPPLVNVCERLTIEGAGQIRDTIMQGRQPNTPMPSWSIRFQGAMNDQQIQDLINYLLTIQNVPENVNKCLDPTLATPTAGPSP